MRIVSLSQPVTEIPFLNAGRGVGGFYVDRLPVQIAQVDPFPAGVRAIVATADLQGRETFENACGHPPRLLGEVLPYQLHDQLLPQYAPADGATGVILAGDFYTVPLLDKRGGTGDVSQVWQEFARYFDWTVGVAGNHDTFGQFPRPAHSISSRSHFLDQRGCDLAGLSFYGVSGIIGNPRRHWRYSDDDYARAIEQAVLDQPDVLVLHDGPDQPDGPGKGSARVRELLRAFDPTLVIRGHAHWDQPLAELDNGTQILNVDCRCVIMVPASFEAPSVSQT